MPATRVALFFISGKRNGTKKCGYEKRYWLPLLRGVESLFNMRRLARRYKWDIYYEQIPVILAMLKFCGRASAQVVVGREKKTLNAQAIGKEYLGKTVHVTPRKIELFAQATHDRNPLYDNHHRHDPKPGLIAPPMFASVWSIHAMMQLFSDKSLHLNFGHMFHAGQDAEWIRLPRPDERVYAKAMVERIVDKGKGELLVTSIDSFTDKEELIARGFSSWYVKKPKELQTDGKEEFRQEHYWEPQTDGELLFLDRVTVDADQMMRYAKIAGDYNFIHISDIVAKIMGMGKKILQGLCTMAFVSKAIVDGLLDGDPHRLKGLNVRFLKNVRAGDVLETYGWRIDPDRVHWEPHWLNEDKEGTRLIGFKTRNQHGDIVVSRGIAKIRNA
jgi:acyl dehydratase